MSGAHNFNRVIHSRWFCFWILYSIVLYVNQVSVLGVRLPGIQNPGKPCKLQLRQPVRIACCSLHNAKLRQRLLGCCVLDIAAQAVVLSRRLSFIRPRSVQRVFAHFFCSFFLQLLSVSERLFMEEGHVAPCSRLSLYIDMSGFTAECDMVVLICDVVGISWLWVGVFARQQWGRHSLASKVKWCRWRMTIPKELQNDTTNTCT